MKRLALAAAAVASIHGPSFAAEPAPAPAPVAPSPMLPAPSPEPVIPPRDKSPELTLAPKPKPWKGFRIQSEDKAYQLRFGGQLQVDALGFAGDDADSYKDEVRIRRSRIDLRGTVARYYDLRVQLEFAASTLSLTDATLETTWLDELRLRVGKTKGPVGWDRLQSGTATTFLERSQTATLTPNRDVGLQLVGKLGGGLLDYQVGIWNGAADGATNDVNVDDGFDFAGRLTFQPFIKADLPALKELLIGFYGSYGEVEGSATSTQLTNYRSAGRGQWFRWATNTDPALTAFADGARVRYGGHLNWQYGPVSVFGEYVASSQEVSLGDVSETITNSAYVAQATWLLTGDDASWTGAKPKADFDPVAGGGPGGVELAVRWTALDIDDAAFDEGFASANNAATGMQSLTVGFNWYLNAWVKLQLDYERTTFDGGAPEGEDRPTENLVGGRAQILF